MKMHELKTPGYYWLEEENGGGALLFRDEWGDTVFSGAPGRYTELEDAATKAEAEELAQEWKAMADYD